MVSVGAHAVADDLGENFCAAGLGVLQLFEDQDAGAFPNHETVAILVEGPAGVFGVVVAGGEGAHGGESTDAHGSDGRFGTTGDHHIGIVALDDAIRVADGVGTGGAGGGGGFVGAFGAVADAHLARGKINDGRGNKKRRNFARAALQHVVVLALDHVESADAGADENAHTFAVVPASIFSPEFSMASCVAARAQMNEAPHFARFFLIHELQRIEVLDFGSEGNGKAGGIETGDGSHPAFGGQQVVPDFRGGIADGGNQPDPGDNDASLQLYLPPFAFLSM